MTMIKFCDKTGQAFFDFLVDKVTSAMYFFIKNHERFNFVLKLSSRDPVYLVDGFNVDKKFKSEFKTIMFSDTSNLYVFTEFTSGEITYYEMPKIYVNHFIDKGVI